jgi:hypothetical protein
LVFLKVEKKLAIHTDFFISYYHFLLPSLPTALPVHTEPTSHKSLTSTLSDSPYSSSLYDFASSLILSPLFMSVPFLSQHSNILSLSSSSFPAPLPHRLLRITGDPLNKRGTTTNEGKKSYRRTSSSVEEKKDRFVEEDVWIPVRSPDSLLSEEFNLQKLLQFCPGGIYYGFFFFFFFFN